MPHHDEAHVLWPPRHALQIVAGRHNGRIPEVYSEELWVLISSLLVPDAQRPSIDDVLASPAMARRLGALGGGAAAAQLCPGELAEAEARLELLEQMEVRTCSACSRAGCARTHSSSRSSTTTPCTTAAAAALPLLACLPPAGFEGVQAASKALDMACIARMLPAPCYDTAPEAAAQLVPPPQHGLPRPGQQPAAPQLGSTTNSCQAPSLAATLPASDQPSRVAVPGPGASSRLPGMAPATSFPQQHRPSARLLSGQQQAQGPTAASVWGLPPRPPPGVLSAGGRTQGVRQARVPAAAGVLQMMMPRLVSQHGLQPVRRQSSQNEQPPQRVPAQLPSLGQEQQQQWNRPVKSEGAIAGRATSNEEPSAEAPASAGQGARPDLPALSRPPLPQRQRLPQLAPQDRAGPSTMPQQQGPAAQRHKMSPLRLIPAFLRSASRRQDAPQRRAMQRCKSEPNVRRERSQTTVGGAE